MRADLLAAEKAEAWRRRFVATAAVLATAGAAWAFGGTAWLEQASVSAAVSTPASSAAPGVAQIGAGNDPAAAAVAPAVVPAALKTRPLSAWLSDVARDAGRDLVISPDLRGDLTASEASDLGWQRRLEAYARVFGFDFAVSDGLIEVTKAGAVRGGVQTENAAPGAAEHGGEVRPPATDVEAGPPDSAPGPPDSTPGPPVMEEPPPQARVVHLVHSAAKDVAAVLDKAGKPLDVTVTADVASNSVVLSGQPAGTSRVLAVLRELDRPRRRILLDAKIVEVTRSARLDLGVEWRITGSTVGGEVRFPPPLSEAGSAALLIATGGASALDARISALEASGKLHVVSRPSVVMMEGSPAVIESARILRIRLPSRGDVVGGEVVESPSSTRATEEIPVGVRLEVLPAIRGGGRVLLRIKAKSSSLGAPLPPDDIPEELSRMVDAEVLVASGETAVLGGLTRESGTKSGSGLPGLRRLPIAGALFGKKTDEKEEEELLVIVTPRVLD